MGMMQQVAPRHLADYLLSRGQPVVDLQQAADLMGLDVNAASDALVRLRRQHQMFSPTRGLYVAVPPQYRTWEAVPALDFVDPMMAALGRDYYVALLSAAELHGAAHQRPQVFQVMTDQALADKDFGRVRVRFYVKANAADAPVVRVNTGTGTARVSSPAATMLDLASRPVDGGGLSNVATVVAELVEASGVDAAQIIDAATAFPASSLRRLGWLLDHTDADIDRDAVAATLTTGERRRAQVYLDARGPRRGHADARWGLVVNAEVEADL